MSLQPFYKNEEMRGVALKVLVTGAGGLIGSTVFKKLTNSGIETYGLLRQDENKNKNYICGNLLEKELFTSLHAYKFDYIIHCAASIPGIVDDCTSANINRIMDDNIIDYAYMSGANIIYCSSASVYGFSVNERVDENSKINCSSKYAKNKYLTEQKLLNQNFKSTILRITSPYGKNQKNNNVLMIFIKNALCDNDIKYYGSGSRTQDFIHVDDICEVVLKCLYGNCEGIFNIASGVPISMFDLATLIISLVSTTKSKVLPAGIPDVQEDFRAFFDISKARKELSWNAMIPHRKGFLEMIDNIRENYLKS